MRRKQLEVKEKLEIAKRIRRNFKDIVFNSRISYLTRSLATCSSLVADTYDNKMADGLTLENKKIYCSVAEELILLLAVQRYTTKGLYYALIIFIPLEKLQQLEKNLEEEIKLRVPNDWDYKWDMDWE